MNHPQPQQRKKFPNGRKKVRNSETEFRTNRQLTIEFSAPDAEESSTRQLLKGTYLSVYRDQQVLAEKDDLYSHSCLLCHSQR